MAGEDPTGNFVADEFRENIRSAMRMGLPVDVAMRPTFYFPNDDTYALAARSGRPWDWTASPVENDPDKAPIQVPCAVEVNGSEIEMTQLGTINPQRALLTILDLDYAKVKGFTEVHISGAVYRYSKLVQAIGLFDTTTYQVEVIARDRP